MTNLNDHKLTEALEAFCKRLIEGSEADPTGGSWDELTPGAQHHLKERYLGPLFAAAQVIAKPATVTTAEELAMVEPGTVIQGPDFHEETYKCTGPCEFYTPGSETPYRPSELVGRGPFTVLHVGGDR